MPDTIKIKNRLIGEGQPCYIIAEMSANHAGKIEIARDIIYAAKEAGADCIKLQTYTPDTMTLNSNKEYFKIKKGTWKGESLYSLYEKAYTPWEWHAELKEEAEKIGLDFFSTPYERSSVDFLEELGVDFYKVASYEVTDIPLLKYIAAKGKPMIISTGMASLGEIEETVKAVRSQGNNQFVLLKCSSAYPAIPEDMNLKTIKHLKETFNVPVGLSDHSMGSIGAVTAVAMGAKVIEKHLCLSREIENPDASFSMEPAEFKKMVEDVRQAEQAIGTVSYELSSKEQESSVFRRSIFVVKDIKAGEEFSEDNLRIIRPGYGLKPKYFPQVLGRKAAKDIEQGTPLDWYLVK